MIELALIGATGLVGLASSALLGRRARGAADWGRLPGLVRAAADRFAGRLARTAGALAAVLAGAIFLAFGLVSGGQGLGGASALERGVWLTVSAGVGAATALAAMVGASWLGARAGPEVVRASRGSVDTALRAALRSGGAGGLLASALSLLGLALLFGALVGLHAEGSGAGGAPAVLPFAPLLLSGYALGGSFAGLLVAVGGGAFAKIAELAADLGGQASGIEEDDAANPAAVADLAGDAASFGAGAAVVSQATGADTLAAMLAAGLVLRQNPEIVGAFALVAFPLVTRAFGLVGALFGLLVVRTDEREHPAAALVRGAYVGGLLHLVGAAGAAQWLLGSRAPWLFGCVALGIAASVGLVHHAFYGAETQSRAARDLAEASRGGPALALLLGAGGALDALGAQALLAAALGALAIFLGRSSGLELGGLLGLSLAAVSVLGSSAFLLALAGFGGASDAARGLLGSFGGDRQDVRGRLQLLASVGASARAAFRAVLGLAAALGAASLVGVAAAELDARGTPLPDLGKAAGLGALSGLLLLAWFVARVLLGAARASRRALDEVRRQALGRDPQRPPEYEVCAAIAEAEALRGMVLPCVAALAAPPALGLVLRFLPTGDKPSFAAATILALVSVGAAVGVLGSLLFASAGTAWDGARRYIATGAHGGRTLVDEAGVRADNPTYVAASVGDAVGDPLKDIGCPALHVLVRILPAVLLVLLPFF